MTQIPPPAEPESAELQAALATLQEAQTKPYYDSQADAQRQASFYSDFTLSSNAQDAYDALHELLERKHTTKPKYKPSSELYPWVDLQPALNIRSIYSGQPFEAEELIRADLRVDAMLESMRSAGEPEESLEMLEAQLVYNCEHVVPQSWFGKQEPMRGDLHHLFACETRCNGFRGNTPYFQFPAFEEVVRDDCGRSEQNKFEPENGKGAVARATLYFLVRYPGAIDSPGEYDASRIEILKRWHAEFPVTGYEQHRNWAIHERQGNRNPFVDHPEWVTQIDFTKGLA